MEIKNNFFNLCIKYINYSIEYHPGNENARRKIMKFKLDQTDIEILSSLIDNGKYPTKELAKNLGIHPNTLLQRIKRLEKNGVITRYTAQINYEKVGYDLHVIMMIKVRKGRAGDMEQLNDLINIREVESLYATTGAWDLIGTARVKNRKHLLDVIQLIGKNEIVVKTSSYLTLFPYKAPYEFNPLKD
jgi:Lrp/AsnC family leucine-responsive transcriptional regulator